MGVNKNKLLILLCCMHIYMCVAFNVQIHKRYINEDIEIEPYHAATTVHKRDTAYHFDKASYTFNGLEKVESVPVLFPIDICLMLVDGSKYATALHMNKAGVRHFAVFRNQNNTYKLLLDLAAPLAVGMDCRSFGERGYVALAFNLTKPVTKAREGAPIYKITGDNVRAVQYFASLNVAAVYLRITGSDLMLLQTYRQTTDTPQLQCPCFVWSGSTFTRMGSIPCSNARHLEPFAMDYESYVAVANYADRRGRTATKSEIYKFNKEQRQFQLFQRIHTNGAVDVRFFSVPHDEVRRQHFLVFGNTFRAHGGGDNKVEEADSVFYVFESGQFVPYQRLALYAVEKFLPVENVDAEKFLLLVAQSNQHVKIYNLNDWKFEESSTQFTDGAFSRGVAQMRIYQEQEETYLVIANELMSEMETNVFRPIFKQEEHANTLRQQIIEWSQATTDRLRQTNVEQLAKDVEAKLLRVEMLKPKLNLKIPEVDKSNIETVLTKSLTYAPLKLNAKYWLALSYANQALDALLESAQTQRTRRDAFQEENSVTVDTLIVRNKLRARRVNGIEVEHPEFESIEAQQVEVTRSYNNSATYTSSPETVGTIEMLNIRNLQVNGKLNGMTFERFANRTLKRIGKQQILEATLSVTQLQANSVRVLANKLNERCLDELVRINGGNYTVQQEVQFTAPIRAERLWVHERLNNLHVRSDGKFDVLLRRSNQTQIVEGTKRFESLRLLEPISVRGPLVGQYWRDVAPFQAVHEELKLQGDFIISGDVHVSQLLQVDDLIDENSNVSVNDVLSNALRWDEPLKNVHLKFAQPLAVNNCHVSYINRHDLQHLVRLNWSMPQIIEGEKIFEHGLTVHEGFAEVHYLNGVDVESLEHLLLLQHTNQTIKVPIHVGGLVARSVQAEQLTLNGSDISQFLTHNTDQTLNGSLKVHQLRTQTLNVTHLNVNGMIFGQTPAAIYEQKSRNAPHLHLFHPDRQFHGTVHVGNLVTGDAANKTTINGRPVTLIEQQLEQLRGDITYLGNFKFNNDLRIENLTFTGNLNGVPAHDFGHCWLTRNGEQAFTAPQTIAGVHVRAVEGIQLDGKLNDVHVKDFYSKAVWTNREEHLENVYFENPIQMLGVLNTPTLNGLRVPEDMLYNTAAEPQVLDGPVLVKGDLIIEGEQGGVCNMTTLNGIDLKALEQYLNPTIYKTLHVEHAHFTEPPEFQTLNQYDLDHTLDEVWLSNENVDLQQHVQITKAQFDGLLELKGPINNMDLTYLKQNYFSLSRPQNVDAEIMFEDTVKYDGDFTAQHLSLTGSIMERSSGATFNFEEFVYHTLKTSGPHTISGQWQLQQADVEGDLREVRINGLNLAQDVLLEDTPYPIQIANKNIESAHIDTLYAASDSHVNNVCMDHWLKDAVYVDHANQTIRGITILDAVKFTNNLQVDGRVNNISFNANTLFLRDRDQSVRGDVRIRSKLGEQQKVLPNNFNHLKTETVNGWNLTEFYANKAKMSSQLEVQGHLIFEQPLVVQQMRNVGEDVGASNKLKRSQGTETMAEDERNSLVEKVVWKLKQSAATAFHHLDHLALLQTLPVRNVLRVLHLKLNGTFGDVLAIQNATAGFTYYTWHNSTRRFAPIEDDPKWLPHEENSLQLMKVLSSIQRHNTTSVLIKNANISTHLKSLNKRLKLQNATNFAIEPLHAQNGRCFALHETNSSEVLIFCFANSTLESLNIAFTIPITDIAQMLALDNERIAISTPNGVEIWNTIEKYKLQHLSLSSTKHMSSIKWHGVTYLAITTATLHEGAVDIFRTDDASRHFTHMQTLNCVGPLEATFFPLPQTDDLLLHVLTTATEQPIQIFKYKGVLGYQRAGYTMPQVPAAKYLYTITLQFEHQRLLVVVGASEISVMNVVLRAF